MQRTWSRVGGRRMVVGVVCVALSFGFAFACLGSTAAPSKASTPNAASTFVSQYPLDDAGQLTSYSLATGRHLGLLVHIPPLKSTAMYSNVSTPHLLANGDYLLTVSHSAVCGSSHGACHRVQNSCYSRVETIDPTSGTVQPLFSVSGAWEVSDAVPSPDGRSVAIVEYSCQGYANQLRVRNLATGQSHLVTRPLTQCGLESDVAWNPSSTSLVFGYSRNPNLDNLPAGCRLATAPADRTTTAADWTTISRGPNCGFDSTAYDSLGLVVIAGCGNDYGGINSTLLQYGSRGQVLYHHRLDSFYPPQYGLLTQLANDPLAHTVLVSEDVTDDPDVSDVWTFNGTTLHHVGNYFGDALLAEP